MNLITRAAAVVIGVALALLATWATVSLLNFYREPLDAVTVTSDPVIMIGDDLIITVTYVRELYCKVDVDRFILRDSDELLVHRERIPGGTTLIGTYKRRVLVNTSHLAVGVYTLREFFHSDCGFRTYTTVAPDLHFRVSDR